MRYCPDCGTPHECTAEGAAVRADVQIAKINAERDVEIARLQSKAVVSVAETEAEHSAEHSEGYAEGVQDTLEVGEGGEAPPVGAPIIVDGGSDDGDDEAIDEGIEEAPPVVEVPTTPTPQRGGWWGNYR